MVFLDERLRILVSELQVVGAPDRQLCKDFERHVPELVASAIRVVSTMRRAWWALYAMFVPARAFRQDLMSDSSIQHVSTTRRVASYELSVLRIA